MRHIDLFTGIGGFAYAAQQIWGTEYQNVFFCENNRFCWEVIKKNFGKDSVIYGDIREVTADSHYERQTKQKQQTAGDKQCDRSITLLTGGFPCQPFSCAGKRRGTEDNRHLWPEMFRVIKDYKPRWIIAENVRGIINIQDGVVFQQVCLDLEREGYEIQAFIIPAVAIGAPHRRDRVWIVAHRTSVGFGGRTSKECGDKLSGRIQSQKCERDNARSESQACIGDISDTGNEGLQGSKRTGAFQEEQKIAYGATSEFCEDSDWTKNWLEVATEICGMDDGLPAELDGFKLTKAGHRVERLKALGNAIVPQVAMEIMRAIKYAEEK